MRYFLEISYNGSSFHGWQIQPNAISVQEEIEKSLSVFFQQKITITGAGRTDTGVNARKMFAHFDIDSYLTDQKRFLTSINHLVGKNIAISNICPVSETAHARFDAIERTYKYFITFKKDPFINTFSCFSPSQLDITAMNEAASILLETQDFTSFAKLHSDNKTNICNVTKAQWLPINDDLEALEFLGNMQDGIVFTITSDRFLRNMVRAVVGTLVQVGRNKTSLNDFKNIIAKKNRSEAGTSMPANALFLWDVKYPYLV